MVIEAEVHGALRAFLRESKPDSAPLADRWPHHLTMGRLVARALRLGRDALIQTGVFPGSQGRYRLSYLMPLMLGSETAVVVGSEAVRRQLRDRDIPELQAWLGSDVVVRERDRLEPGFEGILLASPQTWLRDRLSGHHRFGDGVLTILDGADDLEAWTRQALTRCVTPQDWADWIAMSPQLGDRILDVQVQLTKAIWDRPPNPYEGSLLETDDRDLLEELQPEVEMPPAWHDFWEQLRVPGSFIWAKLDRPSGQFWLYCTPAEVKTALAPVWQRQPTVLVGGALDFDRDATAFRDRIGLGDVTCVKFAPDRRNAYLNLYTPEALPLPNTPEYKHALLRELHELIRIADAGTQEAPIAIVVGDVPLRAILGAQLAAEFGSRVRVEREDLPANGILICGWSFWRKTVESGEESPSPFQLLAIATLPLPSLEDPCVAGQVAHYKQQRQDWFRLYLLPKALSELQRAIAPIRDTQGTVALFDVRTLYRSYGKQILSALSPYARVSSPDVGLFDGEG